MKSVFKDLTYILLGISFAPGAKRGPDMIYMKYLLAKTGMFPKWTPQVSDVLCAAFRAHEVKLVTTKHGREYYYIMPMTHNTQQAYEMVRMFRANGVILHPRWDGENKRFVFRVRNRGQRFMHNVMRVNENANNFQDVMAEYRARELKKTWFKQMFGKFEPER